MASITDPPVAPPRRKRRSIAPDLYERFLAVASIALLGAVIVAIARGRAEWPTIPSVIWVHLATIVVALALTPVLLLQRRGTRRHRRIGWVWAIAMLTTALVSLFIRGINPGGWSWIHILSVITIIGVPATVFAARKHHIAAHRFGIRFAVTGALLIAGFFTFPFDRLLGRWLLG